MSLRRPLLLICIIACLHGLFFIWYQRPDWYTEWPDQDGYRRLGSVLATTGKFTRFPDAPRFVPEVIRTPAYPAFVAAVYSVFGQRQIAVALAQTALFVAIVAVVFAIGRRVGGDGVAAGAAALTALFAPLPYFGALVMTEVWTTLVFTLTIGYAVVAVQERRTPSFAAAGALAALTALSRPVFVLFAVALFAVGVVLLPLVRAVSRPRPAQWLLLLAVCGGVMLPWFGYNYVTLDRFTISPAGGVGRGIWEGSWQAVWSGRVQNELTHLADAVADRAELDRRVAAIAAREDASPGRMLEYVHQWQDIRRIWTTPSDPYEYALARVRADQEYLRVGVDNIRRDSAAHLAKRLARGVFVLWAGEIPFRYSTINSLPPALIRLCWAVQAALVAAALFGIYTLAARQQAAVACVLAAPVAYITAVHFVLLTEARQSLPAMPTVLVLAAVAARAAAGSARYSRSSSASSSISPYT